MAPANKLSLRKCSYFTSASLLAFYAAMISSLLHRIGLLSGLAFWLLMLGAAPPALANHLLGGEMTYRYLGASGLADAPYRYELTITIYNNCGQPAIRSSASVGIFDQATGNRLALTAVNYSPLNTNGDLAIASTSLSACQTPTVPAGCTITGASQPYQLQKFVGIVNLPASSQGFYAVWSDGNRNVDVSNLSNPGGRTMSLYATLAPPTIPNSSPIFSDVAVALVCANDTTYLLNNAVDPDGDRLTYSFGQPYGIVGVLNYFSPPPALVPYQPGFGYSASTPFGAGPGYYAAIDASSGIAKYVGATVGRKYVVAVDVNEYRTIGGQQVLIGTTRRDLQLVVGACPNTLPPTLPTTSTTAPIARNYTIEAGSTLSISLASTQPDGHPLTMTLNSVLLDGAGGYNANLDGNAGTLTTGNPAGTASVTSATGNIASTFVYTAACGDARATPYDVALLIKDEGCAGKLVADVLHITVVKPAGPTSIAGDLLVCGLGGTHSYTGIGATASQISWRVVGGTIVGSRTANPVQVSWPTVGTFSIVARGVAQYGCPTDSLTQVVTVAVPPVLTATASPRTICQGSSTTLTVVGGGTYTVTGGAAPVTGTGPFVLSPAATTTYTITSIATSTTCAATTQLTINVLPQPAANVGAAAPSLCSGQTITLGAAPVAGNTYRWSPATGLSNPAIANPTLTLTNTTSAPTTQTYTLTVVNQATTCSNAATVAVTVNPVIVAGTIGTYQKLCAGSVPAPLTSTAAASGGPGTYAYQWESSPDNVTWTAIAGATGAAYAPSAATATTYYRRQVAANPCDPAVSNVVMVETEPLLVSGVALATPPEQCPGSAFVFTPVPTNAGAAPTYRWFVNNNLVATTTTYTSTTLATGDQVKVELTPTTGFCATGPAVAAVLISLTPVPLPTLSIALQTTLPVCVGAPISFKLDQVANPGVNVSYQWQVDGVDVAGATQPAFTSTTLRDGQRVTLALRTTTGICSLAATALSNTVFALVSPPIDVEAGPDKTITEGDDVTLEGTASGTYPVVWSPAATLTFIGNNQLRPVAAPLVTTTYTLAAGGGSCADQSSVTVTVTPRVRIPNALSPNGDGQDDTWEIDNIGVYPDNHVLVFNRWGNKIFETTNYNRANEWNGTIKGQPAPVGTYYYVITLGNGKKYSGPLTVLY
ncbi:MAG: gliding motility-associated C-terminal domain-containing protein [Hymenobacter sp.]|nr:MAG: gliding motility-associated C-terminal domain-containing protein [Hymenobacter sp.]